ncbi:hypothetical protein [Streptomyces sp. NPDC087298]|uniref:hypothetical protein n=1 Tax=Streptomyces sp. NPDC087298 TaxID=3365779 RepID=UPI00380E062E
MTLRRQRAERGRTVCQLLVQELVLGCCLVRSWFSAVAWCRAPTRASTSIVDSTNLQTHVRAGLVARARYWQRTPVVALFDVPLSVVEAQNAGRDRGAPLHVVRELHQLLPTADQLHDKGATTVHLASDLTATTNSAR